MKTLSTKQLTLAGVVVLALGLAGVLGCAIEL